MASPGDLLSRLPGPLLHNSAFATATMLYVRPELHVPTPRFLQIIQTTPSQKPQNEMGVWEMATSGGSIGVRERSLLWVAWNSPTGVYSLPVIIKGRIPELTSLLTDFIVHIALANPQAMAQTGRNIGQTNFKSVHERISAITECVCLDCEMCASLLSWPTHSLSHAHQHRLGT